MFIMVLFVVCGMTWLYYDLFRENGEEKLYAFVPIFNFYKICSMVEVVWAFWGYSVAFVGSLNLRILARSIFPELCVFYSPMYHCVFHGVQTFRGRVYGSSIDLISEPQKDKILKNRSKELWLS